MDVYPGAVLKLLPEARTQPSIDVHGLIYHSIVGSASAAYNLFGGRSSLESTFIVDLDGTCWQCMYANQRADANNLANRFFASVETADKGNPNIQPWTPPQCHTLCRLGVWYCRTYRVPPRRCPGPYERGFGFHSMWGSPSAWTPVRGKTCPGTVRIQQWNTIILPGIVAGLHGQLPPPEGDDMYTDQDRARDDSNAARTNAIAVVTRALFDDSFAGRASSLKDLSGRKMLERTYKYARSTHEEIKDEVERDEEQDEVLARLELSQEELQDALRALAPAPG